MTEYYDCNVMPQNSQVKIILTSHLYLYIVFIQKCINESSGTAIQNNLS